jgi:nucleoside 2-deoxyribosyltransferase
MKTPDEHTVASRVAFVISPFGDPYDSYFDEIFCPALAKAGMVGKRGDSMFRAGNVIRQIWDLIDESAVVLADVSEPNANVYYELGLAHALGKPCVLITRDTSSIPFDLRNQRHLEYRTKRPRWAEVLEDEIVRAVVETMQRPELSVVFPERSVAVAEAGKSPESAQLLMLQAAVDSLRRQLAAAEPTPGYRPELGLGTADELETLAQNMLAQGSSPEAVVEALRERGAPAVWAESVVRSINSQ